MTTKTTHKQLIQQRMQATKGEICSLLNLTSDAYETLRYDLAIAWLEYQEYFEATARLFILSKTFFNWWYQRLHAIECQFLQNYSNSHTPGILVNKYMEKAITMSLKPSRIVLEAIRKEGFAALERNPNLKTSKIFAV